jgi:hypothetical protein
MIGRKIAPTRAVEENKDGANEDIEGLTEDEFLGRCQHVQTEGNLILVSLTLEPAESGGDQRHLDDLGRLLKICDNWSPGRKLTRDVSFQ